MSEFIEFITPSAMASLEKANRQLVDMVANVNRVNQSLSNTTLPSQTDEAVRELNEQLSEQSRIISSLQQRIENLSRTRQRSNQRTAEEIVNNQVLNRNALEHARINSRLVGAYQRLSAEQSRSARIVQDLISRGRLASQTQREYNRELRNAQNEFNRLNARVLQADRAVGRFNRNVGNYPRQALSSIKDLIGAFGIVGGVSLIAGVAKDIFNVTKELQSLDLALQQVTGNNKIFAESQSFLKRVSEDYGIEIKGLTKQFTQFYVSAKDKISGDEIKQIFESVAKSAGFMGLSVEAQDRAFVALNQMMSKGTVSAEELKGQLGEALPGAFGIMAKALGTTEVGLSKLMKDGKVLASEVLPAFAKQLEKTYGIENKDRVDNLVASQTRLSNAWTDFVRALNSGNGILSRSLIFLIDKLREAIDAYKYLTKNQHEFQMETIKTFKTDYYEKTKKSLNEVADAHDKVTKAMMLQKMAIKNIQDLRDENRERQKKVDLLYKEKAESPILFAMTRKQTFIERELREIRFNNQVISKNAGIIMATNDVLQQKEIKTKKILTDETKKHTEQKKKEIETYREWIELLKDSDNETKGLLDSLEYQKKKLEQEQRMLSRNNIEWRMYQKLIDGVDKSIKQLTDTQDFLGESGKKVADDLKDLGEKMKREEEAMKELQKTTKEFIKDITAGFFQDAGLGSLNFFTQVKESGLTAFEELMQGADTTAEKFAITFKGISDVAKEAFAFINQASENSFNAQISRLDKQKEIALTYAGDSATAREEIEKRYEERRKQIERQRAEQQKKQAMFNIAMNTAQAITAVFAKTPPPAGIPLAALVGAIGAAQLAMVASQEIPAYVDGTDYHKGGLMLVNDGKGSNYQETVITPDGKKIQPKGRNVLMNAPKGTQVLTAKETIQFNQELNNMLVGNGISPNINFDNGMKAEELDVIMGKYFANIQVNQTSIDKNGFNSFIQKRGQKTKTLDAVVTFKGFSV